MTKPISGAALPPESIYADVVSRGSVGELIFIRSERAAGTRGERADLTAVAETLLLTRGVQDADGPSGLLSGTGRVSTDLSSLSTLP
jgi:hypothetical protein